MMCGSAKSEIRKTGTETSPAVATRNAGKCGRSFAIIVREIALVLVLVLVVGCASTAKRPPSDREFTFGRDTFAYANELVWDYEVDPATGEMTTRPRDPKPDYTHHCFVVARAARQFFDFARFDPAQPKAAPAEYRRLIAAVVARDPRANPARREPVVIPGYANLHEFSRDHEALLKEECGGAWQSYVQRGHWRMLWPITTSQQQRMAERLQGELDRGIAPVIHLVRFPQLTINHAVVVYTAVATGTGVEFRCYDPNNPVEPLVITYRNEERRFHTPPNNYFIGGRVDVYEVYRNWWY